MNTAEIVLLVLGFISISISCFIGNKKNADDIPERVSEGDSRDIWTEKEENMVREQIHSILSEEKENILAETTDHLNRKSNEKIMEFDEFSSQLLEKINHNHEEVVFMYSMLNEKEKELKEDVAKRTVKKKAVSTDASSEIHEKKEESKKSAAGHKAGNTQMKAEKEPGHSSKKEPGTSAESANEEIINMYKQGKSVLEISKELNIGQGEVKLMIALYGGNI